MNAIIEVRSERGIPEDATDAWFWAKYLEDEEPTTSIFDLPEKCKLKKSVKGGEGSGHHDHGGLSGVWGGSAPSGRAKKPSTGKPKAPKKKPPVKKPPRKPGEDEPSPEDIAAQEHHASERRKQRVLLEAMEDTILLNRGHEPLGQWETGEILHYTDLSPEDFKYMFSLPGARTEIIFDEIAEAGVLMTIHWYDLETDEVVGRAVRELKHYDGICYNHSLKIEEEWQSRGLAASLYARQKALLTEWSYDEIRLEADITIGRYAWAKEGFEYVDPASAGYARTGLKHWLGRNGMRDLAKKHADRISKLNSPRDFATFSIPDVMISGRQIENIAVKPDYEMIVGKAFMLDREGHGSWHGRYKL